MQSTTKKSVMKAIMRIWLLDGMPGALANGSERGALGAEIDLVRTRKGFSYCVGGHLSFLGH